MTKPAQPQSHTPRHLSPMDTLLGHVERAMLTVAGTPVAARPNPSTAVEEGELSEDQRKHVAGLMRINHVGEVCAQALYQGQAITARSSQVREAMSEAADEENDHLAWCEQRLSELSDRHSLLNPLWYSGSLALGVTAGLIGDRWNLGFLAETERQVVKHLDEHLQELPEQDKKSRAVLEQMRMDEQAHATKAVETGAAELPLPVQQTMGWASKLMKAVAYRV